MRLIDADLAQKIADKELQAEDAGKVQFVLAHTGTIEPESLRPKSYWEFFSRRYNGQDIPYVRCKRCRKERPFTYGFKFCNNCGAKMEDKP